MKTRPEEGVIPPCPTCPCCRAVCAPFDSARILGRLPVHYYRCERCGLIRTQTPYWLTEAYSTPIASMDVGLVSRCWSLAATTEAVVRSLPGETQCLDWAGGYGLLTRLLRDRGLSFFHCDPYTSNIFAKGCEGTLERRWSVITFFEVMEHLVDPMVDLAVLSEASPVLLFTTELLPAVTPRPGEWWYYTLETGQHVTFYTERSLRELAERLGMELVSNGTNMHAFYRAGTLPRLAKEALMHRRLARTLSPMLRRLRPTPSLLELDFTAARASAGQVVGH